VSQHLNLDHFLTAYALQGLLADWDGLCFRGKNAFLYKDPGSGCFESIPGTPDLTFNYHFDPLQRPYGGLPRRIWSTPSLNARLRAELNHLIEVAWIPQVLLDRMERARATLHAADRSDPALRRDVARFDATHPSMILQVVERRRGWRPV
jgi:hypothetical protein